MKRWMLGACVLMVACGEASAQSAARKPVTVSLTFDDQRVSQSVVPELLGAAGRGFKATFFIISRYVDTPENKHPESLSVQQLRALERAGHELGGHTRTHPSLSQLERDAQVDEICGGREDLLGYGLGKWRPIVSFAYPGGEHDEELARVVQDCGFSAARTVDAGPETIPPRDAFALRTARAGSIRSTDSLSSIEGWISGAAPGQWVQLVWHDILSPEHAALDDYAQSVEDFSALLDFLQRERAAGRVVIRTIGDVVRDQPR